MTSAAIREDEGLGQLVGFIMAYTTSQCVYVLAKLGIPDLLAEQDRPADELAPLVDADPSALYRLLRTLASEGILEQGDDGRFRLNAVSRRLCTDVQGSMRPAAIMCGEEQFRAFGDLLHTVRTGEAAFQHVFGVPLFEYLGDHPAAAAAFHGTMTAELEGFRPLALVPHAYDFSSAKEVVDVGGGQGRLIAAILRTYPTLRGVLFDVQSAAEVAAAYLGEVGVADRCSVVAGDFFESVPRGADAYILSTILHDWDDAHAARILSACRRSMDPASSLLIIERIVPDAPGPSAAKSFDVVMMAITGGKERTAREFRDLLDHCDLRLVAVHPLDDHFHLVEARCR